MSMSIISVKRVSHIALKTNNVGLQADFYAGMVGLSETRRDAAGRVYLCCNANHYAVVLIPSAELGLDHYALEVGGPGALESTAAALTHAGVPYEREEAGETDQGISLRLRDPDGFVVELVEGMTHVTSNDGKPTFLPQKLGHLSLRVRDCKRSAAFYSDVLGFRVSDWVDDTVLWMRCNTDHHGLAFAKADWAMLHHFAFEVADFSCLGRQADHLVEHGSLLVYGPGRHGPGHNQFIYFRDREGNMVEFTCDVQQIWDEQAYRPRAWSAKENWSNLWGPAKPPDF